MEKATFCPLRHPHWHTVLSVHPLTTCSRRQLTPGLRPEYCRGHRGLFTQPAFPVFPVHRAPVLTSDFHTSEGLDPVPSCSDGLRSPWVTPLPPETGEAYHPTWSVTHNRNCSWGCLGKVPMQPLERIISLPPLKIPVSGCGAQSNQRPLSTSPKRRSTPKPMSLVTTLGFTEVRPALGFRFREMRGSPTVEVALRGGSLIFSLYCDPLLQNTLPQDAKA